MQTPRLRGLFSYVHLSRTKALTAAHPVLCLERDVHRVLQYLLGHGC